MILSLQKMTIVFAFSLAISAQANAKEASWEDLKGLKTDAKSKKTTISEPLKKLMSKEMTIKGFMMPLDFESREVTEFLLMPYIPSCSHVPPPPENQLILVKMDKKQKVTATFDPVEVTGLMSVEVNVDFESAYKMQAKTMKTLKNVELPTAIQGMHQ